MSPLPSAWPGCWPGSPSSWIALADARRIARRKMGRLETDLRIRTEGSRVLVDIDVEGETVPIPARSIR